MRKLQSKVESFKLNWPRLVPIFPANQLLRVNYRCEIHSSLSLCEEHPLELETSSQLPQPYRFILILLVRSTVVRALPMTTMSFYN